MKSNPHLFKLVLILLFILFILLFGIFILCSGLWNFAPKPISDSMIEMIEIAPSRNESSFALVSSTEFDMTKTDSSFLSFSNPNEGIYTFVKPIGGERFSCEGSCYCEKRENENPFSSVDASSRRISFSSTLVSRFSTILLSAFSLAMAQEMSEKVFQEECEKTNTIEDICDPKTFKIKTLCSEDPYVRSEDTIREYPEVHRYKCTGTCRKYGRNTLPTDTILTRHSKALEEYWSQNDCEEFRMEKISHLYTFQFHYPFCGDDLNWFETENPTKEEYFRRAESCMTFKFVLYHLDKYCREQSLIPNKEKEIVYGCDSGSAHWEGPFLFEVEREKMENPSIKCTLIGNNPNLSPF